MHLRKRLASTSTRRPWTWPTSIRTRSGNTGRRAELDHGDGRGRGRTRRFATTTRSGWFHLHGWRGATCSALVVLLLVSCSTGDARDERKFEAQEAERTQQVPQAQKTELADTFLQPTGTPQATMT